MELHKRSLCVSVLGCVLESCEFYPNPFPQSSIVTGVWVPNPPVTGVVCHSENFQCHNSFRWKGEAICGGERAVWMWCWLTLSLGTEKKTHDLHPLPSLRRLKLETGVSRIGPWIWISRILSHTQHYHLLLLLFLSQIAFPSALMKTQLRPYDGFNITSFSSLVIAFGRWGRHTQ